MMVDRRLVIGAWTILLLARPPVAAGFDIRELTNQFAHPSHSEKRGISLDEAVSRARRKSDDKVLSAETVRVDGRRVHRIKILTSQGRVKHVQIDADTGRPAARRR
jgi:uncharacterized membrane protein YkoI